MSQEEKLQVSILINIVLCFAIITSNLLSCTQGYDNGKYYANEQWEKKMVERGYGTYESVTARSYQKFKFKDEK